MPYLPAAKREYLARPLALIVMLVVIVIVLLLLFPRKDILENIILPIARDELSVDDLQALLKTDPGDVGLRMLLSRNLIEQGAYDEALRNINPLLSQKGSGGEQARLLAIELKLTSLLMQEPENPQRQRYLDAMARKFRLEREKRRAASPRGQPKPRSPESRRSSEINTTKNSGGKLENPGTGSLEVVAARRLESGQRVHSGLKFMSFIGVANAVEAANTKAGASTTAGKESGLEMQLEHRIRDRDPDMQSKRKSRPAVLFSGDTGLTLRLTYHIAPANIQQAEGLHFAILLKQDDIVIDALPRLAKRALELERPDIAASMYEQLALGDTDNNISWLMEAARWNLAAERPLDAGWNYADASAASELPGPASKYALLSLNAMISANSGKGLDQARQYVSRFPSNAAILNKSISIAIAQGKLDLAREWGRKLVVLEPDNRAAHKRLAEVAEWSGHPGLALQQWKWLARRQGDSRTIDHALDLAIALYDSNAALEMLELKRKQGSLTEQEFKQLATVYESLGEPEQAVSALQNYLQHFPGKEDGWKQLALLQEQQGDLHSALATWGKIEKRFGSNNEYTAKRAELLWRLQRPEEALLALRQVSRQQNGTDDVQYWTLYGELAWVLEENGDAIIAYRQLWLGKGANPLVAERLILLARDAGQIDEVVAVGEVAWKRYQSPRLLLLAMDAAANAGHWQDVSRMVKVARQNEASFQSSTNYWLIRGQLAVYLGHKRDAIVIYEQALLHYPGNTGIRISLIWLLIEVDDRRRMAFYLGRWRQDAAIDPVYWNAYAAAYFQLELVKASLPWYDRYAKAHPGEYLWLLSYADALQKAGLHTAAWRMRRYALIKLRPQAFAERLRDGKPDGKFLRAYALLMRELRSLPRGEVWAKSILKLGKDDPAARDFAIFWYLNDERFPHARHWLMKQHAERQKIPAWKRMLIALDDNDLEKVARILEEPESLTTISRMFATRSLSRDDRGLELAMDNGIGAGFTGERETTLLRNVRNAYNRVPNAVHAGIHSKHLGNLGLTSYAVQYYRSRNNRGLELRLSRIKLRDNSGTLSLRGRDVEQDLEISRRWQDRRGVTRLGLGINRRGDKDLTRFKLSRSYEFSGRTSGQLKLAINELSEETSAQRAVGARDRLSASLYTNLSLRDFASLEIGLNRYHSRSGNALANGYSIDMLLGHRLMLTNSLAETQWQVWGQATIDRNSFEAGLPADVASIMPAGAGVGSVIPARYYLLGIGTGLQRGIPGSPESIARTLSYRIEAWLGWQWPDSSLAYSLRIGIGAPLFGRDRLSLDAFYSNTSRGGFTGESFRGIGVWYSWRFGR